MRRVKSAKITNLTKIIVIVFIICLILSGYLVFKSNFFTVGTVDISLNGISCADEESIREESGALNKNIFLQDKISEGLKSKFICIKDVKVEKKFPNKISLNIRGREGAAQILAVDNLAASAQSVENISTPSAAETGDSFLIDEEGVIFSKGQLSSGAKIYILGQSISLGGKLEDEFLTKTLSIIKVLKDLGVDELSIYILDNLLIVYSNPKIIFNLAADQDIQIASLQLILQKAKIENKQLEFIDLRFNKPIIKYAPKK